jgi:periplasmic divalent cation tolerance protein
MSLDYSTVYITARDAEEARRIGLALVREKLAACVNYFPIQSIYRWQGKIEENQEVALLVKTRKSLVQNVIEKTRELHSYEVPCIECWPVEKGYSPYLQWIEQSTQQEQP